ncbi:MAG: Eco29kI family restriction endonuclease [Chloroflexi bacterium]|nr:Eco29kI family restriction endonuclease [Chloroflexota bacterium]
MLERGLQPLPPPRFGGAGIYAIYYFGAFPAYAPIAPSGAMAGQEIPIYVGKAVPAGSRQGGMGLGLKPNTALFSRLSQHVRSIEAVSNLALPDFACRYLVVDDIWIPLGEALLIERYRPLWNRGIDGFGNHDQGATRRQAKRSAWDTLHPGRPWAGSFQPHGQTVEAILARIAEAFEHPERVPPPLDSGAQDDGSVV